MKDGPQAESLSLTVLRTQKQISFVGISNESNIIYIFKGIEDLDDTIPTDAEYAEGILGDPRLIGLTQSLDICKDFQKLSLQIVHGCCLPAAKFGAMVGYLKSVQESAEESHGR